MPKNEKSPVEIKEELTTLLSQDTDIKQLLTVSFKETVISTYNSHFPESQELEKLEKIVPGITVRMLNMMEKHQDREIAFDKEMIQTENRRISTIEKDIDKTHNTNRLGQALGFIIALTILGLAGWLISLEEYKTAIGLIMGSATIGGLVGAFTGYLSKATPPENENNEK